MIDEDDQSLSPVFYLTDNSYHQTLQKQTKHVMDTNTPIETVFDNISRRVRVMEKANVVSSAKQPLQHNQHDFIPLSQLLQECHEDNGPTSPILTHEQFVFDNKEPTVFNDPPKFEKPGSPILQTKVFNDDDLFKKPEPPTSRASAMMKHNQTCVRPNNSSVENEKENISNEAFRKTNKAFDINNDNEHTSTLFQGFMTASNKKIVVSDEALARAKRMHEDNEIDGISTPFQGFKTVSNKTIKISDNAFDKAEGFLRDNEYEQIATPFQGFMTASNKKIIVSDDALAKAKNMFEDNEGSNIATPFQGFKTASNKLIKVSDDALHKAKKMFSEGENIEVSASFQGFKTASNKTIKISNEALNKASELFKDDENDGVSTSLRGFKDTNHKTNKVFSDYRNNEIAVPFQGFMTASNKKIDVSDEALARAKRMHEDNEIDSISTPFQRFKTASNKVIKVSDDALHKAKKLFNDEENIEGPPSFQGFKTASNKDIKISNDALDKAKQIFEESEKEETPISFRGFKTASNKTIQISDEALGKAQKMFNELNENSLIKDKLSIADETDRDFKQNSKINVEHLFEDEQTNEISKMEVCFESDNLTLASEKPKEKLQVTTIVHNFNKIENKLESLTQEISDSTSAFLEDEINCSITAASPKSPILTRKTCFRRAKKFVAPFKKHKKKSSENLTQDQPTKKRKLCDEKPILVRRKTLSDLCGTLDSKINLTVKSDQRRYNLKDLYDRIHTVNHHMEIEDCILNLSVENYKEFVFSDERQNLFEGEKCSLSIFDVEEFFYNHVDIDKSLIPTGWIMNHLKWIVWKLASYERLFRNLCFGVLNVKNVLNQLKYRYDRELFKTQRPILRKIIETDDVPGRRMILCVSKIFPENKVDERIILEVTDGWYGIPAELDAYLSKIVRSGKISVGTKLLIYGAELVNCLQGKSPLEDLGDTKLLLHGNSCRRAKPWTKLGLYSKNCGPPKLSILKSHCQGGNLPLVPFIAINIYPSLFIEKLETGDTITRSEKIESQYCSTIEMENQLMIEKIYNEVEIEYSSHHSNSLREVMSECRDFNMPACADTQDIAASLSISQKKELCGLLERKQFTLKTEIDAKVKKLLEEKGVTKKRKVVEVLKVKGLIVENNEFHFSLLSIWKPNDDLKCVVKENKMFNLYNVTPTGRRYNIINLSAGQRTIIKDVDEINQPKYAGWEKYKRKVSLIREMQSPSFSSLGNEVDTAGIVFHIEPPMNQEELTNSSKVQTLYLSDENQYILAINFWGGIKKYGYENIVNVGSILACTNLQHRPRFSIKKLRYLYATEMSTFTQNPKKEHTKELFLQIKEHFIINNIDKSEFVEECLEKLNSIMKSKRVQTDESSLENLDFESTFVDSTKSIEETLRFNQSDNWSFSKLNESNVEKRLKKLEMYGEPPPLPQIQLNMSTNLSKDFVVPISRK